MHEEVTERLGYEKRQCHLWRLDWVNEIAPSLHAKGLTTSEISAHFAKIYGASVTKETIPGSQVLMIEEMNDWSARSLDEMHAGMFIKAVVRKSGTNFHAT